MPSLGSHLAKARLLADRLARRLYAMARADGADAKETAIEATIFAPEFRLPAIGASIACAGCCLTVIEKGPDWFAIQASAETLSKTTLADWGQGTRINLERALKIGDDALGRATPDSGPVKLYEIEAVQGHLRLLKALKALVVFIVITVIRRIKMCLIIYGE